METPTESTELQTDARAETHAGPSDVELVSEVRAGQEAAFEELFRRHRRRVALIASRFFRHREQIEEVVQESFAKAFFALGEFSNRQAESFGAWLSRIAFNVCYDELRRLKRRPESSLSELDEDEAAWLRERSRSASEARGVESQAVARELAAKLLAKLGPEDRLVLVMLDVEGLSTAEIAEVTGWSVSKVKVRAHRARAHLRRVLKRFV
ncbi:MAG TPA: sigma-70 family RNA polymerase sigma factor [Pyrinomonadaceae bacterium]|nr:sigma-70 family RNA polymerase sigma factor [Pyrinomonadaceae bacterium]